MRVVLIGGSRLLRGGLKLVLEESGTEVFGEYSSTEEVRPSRQAAEPIVYLLLHGAGPRGIRQQINDLRRVDEGCRITVMLSRLAVSDLVEVFGAGGDGVVLEEINAQALHDSLRLVALGEKVFPSQLAALLSNGWGAEPVIPEGLLTERELEIVRRLALGQSNKEIANELALAVATVKVHVKSTLKKLGVSNRTQAAIWALNAGLVSPPQVTVKVDGPQRRQMALENDTAPAPNGGGTNGGADLQARLENWRQTDVETPQFGKGSNAPAPDRSTESRSPSDRTR